MPLLFLKIVNMSIAASWFVIAVLLLRLILKKTPKWISVLLWGLVALRLICPFSIESAYSLIPSAETVPEQVISGPSFDIRTGIPQIDVPVNDYIGDHYFEGITVPTNNGLTVVWVLTILWIAGVAAMLIYAAVSYILLRKRVATAVLLKNNVYQSENADSPFVLGLIKPRVYLPFRMDSENLEYVIAHEEAHIRRRDHWWKPLGFVLLALYWFNPFIWLGYILLCRDIELACDEKVIREMDNGSRADYTQALVACSIHRRSIAACPLAFGEVGVKERVKFMMHYKKPAFWIVLAAVILCAVAAVCFLTDPLQESQAAVINYDVTPPNIINRWEKEYIPGAEDILGNVDTEKYSKISPDFEIGADWMGMAVFKDPHKAFSTMVTLYTDAIAAIQQEFDLPPLSAADYELYKTYGWQITSGSEERKEQARFVTGFFDIYENSFIRHEAVDDTQITDVHNATLKTYYELSNGTYMAEDICYKYKLEITGRMHGAAKDSTFVYLSNLETITFDQAWRAAGLGSNTEDYFSPEEAVLVEWNVPPEFTEEKEPMIWTFNQ